MMTKLTGEGHHAYDIDSLSDNDRTMIERSIERLHKPRKTLTITINVLWVAAIILTIIGILFS